MELPCYLLFLLFFLSSRTLYQNVITFYSKHGYICSIYTLLYVYMTVVERKKEVSMNENDCERGCTFWERLALHSVAEQKGCSRHWRVMGHELQCWTLAAWQGD